MTVDIKVSGSFWQSQFNAFQLLAQDDLTTYIHNTVIIIDGNYNNTISNSETT